MTEQLQERRRDSQQSPAWPGDFVERIAQRLASPLPGRRAHRPLAHALSYGRHSGPAPGDARLAAVLVLLAQRNHSWFVPLLVRPDSMPSHAGQIAFPGGMSEPGEPAQSCALREAEEELGIPTDAVRCIGQLTPVYIYVSNFQVTPCVAVAQQPPPLRPDFDEVEAAFEMPIDRLWDPNCQGDHVIHRHGVDFRTPHLEFQGRRIWGATRLILGELEEVIRDAVE